MCASCFAIDYLFCGVYLAERRLDYVFSFRGLVGLLVILPVLPVSFYLPMRTIWFDGQHWRFLYPVRFMQCYLECKAVLSRCHSFVTPVRQFAMLCYLQLVLIIAGAAGIIQIAETPGDDSATYDGDWTFFSSFFNSVLVFVTIQTPPADNVLAKCFVGALVIVLILIVPYQVSRVLDLGKSFSQYELADYKTSNSSKHIVLCGDLTPSRIDHFFREIFHDDHDMMNVNVVVLSEEPPSTSMVSLLMDPFFDKRTRFIQGSLLDVDDAQRAACGEADAIFILSRRCGQEDHMTSDHRTLMRVMTAKRLVKKDARIFAQMHLSSNRHLMENLGIRHVLYFSELMHSLLGQSCVCPGFATFIYNLTSTSSYDGPEDNTSTSWQERYLRGSSHEVYSVELPSSEVVFGKTFSEVASLVYLLCSNVIVFAIESTDGTKILLNPGDSYTCMGNEIVFVIAKDRREADSIKTMQINPKIPPMGWAARSTISASLQKQSSSSSPEYAQPQRRKSKMIDWQMNANLNELAASSKPKTGTAQDAVVDNVAGLDLTVEPIVVCILSPTAFPHHFEFLVGPLRVKALQHHRPIIIITIELPDKEQYETFRHFSHVHFVVGSPYHASTLRRAGIYRAYKIVIMGAEGEVSDSGSYELLSDAVSLKTAGST